MGSFCSRCLACCERGLANVYDAFRGDAESSGRTVDADDLANEPRYGFEIDWTSSDPSIQRIRAEKHKFATMPLKTKRKLYLCDKTAVQTLDNIRPWGGKGLTNPAMPRHRLVIRDLEHEEETFPLRPYDKQLNRHVSLMRVDITLLEIDAIVNSANSQLMSHLEVGATISRHAGSLFREECALLNGCPVGQAKVTSGFRLPAKYVIHTVAPRNGGANLLKSCYRSCLEKVKEYNLKTVAFPCIGAGEYGFSLKLAARSAVETVREWMDQEKDGHMGNLDRVIFCVSDEAGMMEYETLLEVYFPVNIQLPFQ